MPRNILIVEDNEMNRKLLHNILDREYVVFDASNGEEALVFLHKSHKLLSAILLDIYMPVMDGFEVLKRIRNNAVLSQIPVIITTGSLEEDVEVKALSLGANAYISKPYNPALVLHCLRNTINMRENASIINAIQRDKLTGLYNREAFFDKVTSMINEREPGYYLMSCFDIDNFKLINDQYTSSEGDRLLKNIGAVIKHDMSSIDSLVGRISADNFAMLYPAREDEINFVSSLIHADKLVPNDFPSKITFSVGRYIVTDQSLAASTIYDRAYMAKNSIKGRYDAHIAYFDESMREKLIREQIIINEMDAALMMEQFEIWFQPQFNHTSGALIGAEALVRWRHPTRNLIPPSEFIPVFEQNGFIYELDKYIWERVCRHLQKGIAEDRSPLPLSVNISRYDIFRADFIDTITSIVKKYDIPSNLLHLEITESAFAMSSDRIVNVAKHLMERGFIVEIDDFGSGYSSLNMLKDVPANVLKLDMRFLESNENLHRSGEILRSVVRMARWLNMSVIAEGVETVEQADFLKSIGCNYIQGYLYSRPIPSDEYERLEISAQKEERHFKMHDPIEYNTFWGPQSIESLIFNSCIGGACVFEYCRGQIDMLRVNDKYPQFIGAPGLNVEDIVTLDWEAHLDGDNSVVLANALKQSVETDKEVTAELEFFGLSEDDERTILLSHLRVLASCGEQYLVYCTNENITHGQQIIKSDRIQSQIIEPKNEITNSSTSDNSILLDNLSCGAALFEYNNRNLTVVYLNKRYCDFIGTELVKLSHISAFEPIHPDDRENIVSELKLALRERRDFGINIRLKSGKDNTFKVFRFSGSIIKKSSGNYYVCATYTPISSISSSYEQMLPMALAAVIGSSSMSFVKDSQYRYICCSHSFAALIDISDEKDIIGKTDYDFIDAEYADKYHAEEQDIIEKRVSFTKREESLNRPDGTTSYTNVSKYPLFDADKNIIGIYCTMEDITKSHEQGTQLKFLTDNIPGGISTYICTANSIKITYFNDEFLRMFGYTPQDYEEFHLLSPKKHVFEDDAKKLKEHFKALRTTGRPIEDICRIHTKSGGMRWVRYKATVTERTTDSATVNVVLLDITELQKTAELLRISNEEHRLAVLHSSHVISRFNIADRVLTLFPETASLRSIPECYEDIPYGPAKQGLVSADTMDAYVTFFENIIHGAKSDATHFQMWLEKSWRWLEARSTTIFSDTGKPVTAVVSFFDVTDRLEKEKVYKKWQQSFLEKDIKSYTLFRCNISKDASFDTAVGELLHIHFASEDMTFNERTAAYLKQFVYDEDKQKYGALLDSNKLLMDFYRGKHSYMLDYREKQNDGSLRWRKLSLDLVEQPNSTDVEAYLMFEDIDEIKHTELLTLKRAESDTLTGVLNRATLSMRIEEFLAASEPDDSHAMLMLDVDGFKLVNDSFGHIAGDNALIEVAKAMQSVCRPGDFVGRLGGDEFVMFIKNIRNDSVVTSKAREICDLVRKSFSAEVQISASIGIVVCPRDGKKFTELYQKADTALYHVKGLGKDGFSFYQQEMEEENLELEQESSNSSSKRRRILIVDDNTLDYELISGLLKDDFIIEKAKDGYSALIRLHHYGSAISAVLLDLIMPGLNGFDVLAKMQKSPDLQKIPVVVVSGENNQETCLKAIRSGALDFVTKPIDPELLLIRVKSAISKAENEQLRTQNSYLELSSNELAKYRIVLENMGTIIIEMDWSSGTFSYDRAVSMFLAGVWNDRKLWDILLSDQVANGATVREIQKLICNIAEDRNCMNGKMMVKLQTTSKAKHWFCMSVYKLLNEYRTTDKLIIAFNDVDSFPDAIN